MDLVNCDILTSKTMFTYRNSDSLCEKHGKAPRDLHEKLPISCVVIFDRTG